jgi:hypothetical protein
LSYNDFGIVNVALPTIQGDLHFTPRGYAVSYHWVLDELWFPFCCSTDASVTEAQASAARLGLGSHH